MDGNREYATRTATVNGKRADVQMHRFILGNESEHTDHINHNGLDNRKENLRACTRSQNLGNRLIQKHSSRFKGVSFYRPTGKWAAYIGINKKKQHLGYFQKEEDAALEYDRNAKRVFGSFSRTNQEMGAL